MKKSYTHFTAIAALLIALMLIATMAPYKVNALGSFSKTKDTPQLISVLQISPDTIKIIFNKKTDIKKATDPNNYWVQDLSNDKPSGIGTLGKEESPTSKNTLAAAFATITPVDGSNRIFQVKFNDSITTGTKYRLIVSSVTAPNALDYAGENGISDFIGK